MADLLLKPEYDSLYQVTWDHSLSKAGLKFLHDEKVYLDRQRILILPIVDLDHSERNFVFCQAGFKHDLTSSVFMQSFGKAGVALNAC